MLLIFFVFYYLNIFKRCTILSSHTSTIPIPKEIEKYVKEVSHFWNGAHLYLQIINKDTAPSMDWYTVRFPLKHLSDPINAIKTTLYHEWGHRTISPESPEKLKIWQLLVLKALKRETSYGGFDESGRIITNMVTDLWVDSYYLNKPSTKKLYLEGVKFSINEAKVNLRKNARSIIKKNSSKISLKDDAKKTATLFEIFIILYDKIIASVENKDYQFKNSIAEKSYEIVFNKHLSEEKRLVRFAKLVKDLLPEVSDFVKILNVVGELKDAQSEDYPVDKVKIITAIKKHGIKAVGGNLKSVFGLKKGIDLYAQIKELSLYSEVIETVEDASRKSHQKKQFVGFTRWRVGQNPNDLQVEMSIERSGMIIPNFTTLRKNHINVGNSNDNSGTANICLVADDSASMLYDNRLNLVQEAMFSIILSAEKRGDTVSLLIFGSEIAYEQKPTTDYDLLKRIVASMEGASGGTVLSDPISKATRIAQKVEKQTTFIFTDSYVFESTKELHPYIEKLGALSKLIVFAFSENVNDAKTFKNYFDTNFENRFYYVPKYAHFYESSLEELYNG